MLIFVFILTSKKSRSLSRRTRSSHRCSAVYRYFFSSLKASSTFKPLTFESWEIVSVSWKARRVSLLGISSLTSNGKPPTAIDFRGKTLMAAVRESPSSPYIVSACFFKLLSKRTLKFLVAMICPLFTIHHTCIALLNPCLENDPSKKTADIAEIRFPLLLNSLMMT